VLLDSLIFFSNIVIIYSFVFLHDFKIAIYEFIHFGLVCVIFLNHILMNESENGVKS